MDDWLALPGEDTRLPNNTPEKNPDLPPKPVKKPPGEALLAQKRGSFPALWRQLQPRQRAYLEALVKAGFNKSRAIRVCAAKGFKLERHTPLRWKNDPTYAKVYETIENAVLGDAVNPATMLLQADEILHRALRGTKRYDKEGKYLGREPQLDTALRANEQKMKATGMLRGEEKNTRVTVRLVNLAGQEGQKIIDGQAVEVTTDE